MVLILILILLALLILFIYMQSRGFKVVRYSFVNDRLKIPHYRFAVITDLHDFDHGNDNADVLKDIDNEKPDGVIFVGDMVTSSMEPEYHDGKAIRFIRAISAKYPVYYGIGNHEEKLRRCPDDFPGEYERYCNKLADMGISMLLDEKVSIEEAGIDIYGLDLEHEYYRKLKTKWISDDYLEGKFGKCDRSRVSILLAHNPEQFDQYAKWHPDFVLSGHVHGGIINLPLLGGIVSPQLKLFPKYDAGLFAIGDTTMVLSRGLGTHTIPVRIFNKSEVIIMDLYKENKGS